MITQALTNLLKNAAESIEAAAKDMEKNSLEGIIAIKLCRIGPDLEISIYDTGSGLNSKVNNYFEPYVTTKETGTGLGLAITRKIIEQHEGSLELSDSETIIDSKVVKGANARILIPLISNDHIVSEDSGSLLYDDNKKINKKKIYHDNNRD